MTGEEEYGYDYDELQGLNTRYNEHPMIDRFGTLFNIFVLCVVFLNSNDTACCIGLCFCL